MTLVIALKGPIWFGDNALVWGFKLVLRATPCPHNLSLLFLSTHFVLHLVSTISMFC